MQRGLPPVPPPTAAVACRPPDCSAEEQLQPRESSSSDDGPEPTLAPEDTDGSHAAASPMAPGGLSRRGSLTSLLLASPPPRKGRSTFIAKAAGFFTAAMLGLPLLAVVGVVLFFGPAPQGAAPAARLGATLALLPAAPGNGSSGSSSGSQRLVVFGGRGQAGYTFHDLHTFK